MSDSWIDTDSIYTYVITIPDTVGISNIKKVEIVPAYTSTVNQRIAYMKCILSGGTISDTTLTLQALGKKPSVDIPILVIIRGEL